MCNPLLMGAAMGGGSLIQGLGQRDAVQEMNKINEGIAKQNERNAIEAGIRGMETVALKARQQAAATGQQARNVRLQAALAMGKSVAGAAKAGIEGSTPEEIDLDLDLQEALAMSTLDQQAGFNRQARQQELTAIEQQTQARINAVQFKPQPVPSMGSIAFGALSSAFSGAMMGQQMTSGGKTGFFSGESLDPNATWWDKLTLL